MPMALLLAFLSPCNCFVTIKHAATGPTGKSRYGTGFFVDVVSMRGATDVVQRCITGPVCASRLCLSFAAGPRACLRICRRDRSKLARIRNRVGSRAFPNSALPEDSCVCRSSPVQSGRGIRRGLSSDLVGGNRCAAGFSSRRTQGVARDPGSGDRSSDADR